MSRRVQLDCLGIVVTWCVMCYVLSSRRRSSHEGGNEVEGLKRIEQGVLPQLR